MNRYLVKPGEKVRLKEWDSDDTGSYKDKESAKQVMQEKLERLDELQERLYAEGRRSLLIVLQAMDTGGKDGTIRHVMSGVNHQGCRVASFKAPTQAELAHDFLWRIHREVPGRGMIGIFNRSHYEDVLITRVHGWVSDKLAEKRFRQINDFERLLAKNGTTILKFFLHISKEEQRKRLQERIDEPKKRWKFNRQDLEERRFWGAYMRAYEEAIEATSTQHAPWYIIPADKRWYRNLAVADTIVDTLEDMNPRYPKAPPGIPFRRLRVR
jgi:PPK2 family polyphosphate:nucleotide phosphotransferase